MSANCAASPGRVAVCALDYILGARERSDAVVRKIVLENDDPFVPLLIERKAGETQLFVKQVKVEGVRYVVCRNEEEAENDRKDREAIVTALDAQLKKGDKALIGNSAYRRYLRKVAAKGTAFTPSSAPSAQAPPRHIGSELRRRQKVLLFTASPRRRARR